MRKFADSRASRVSTQSGCLWSSFWFPWHHWWFPFAFPVGFSSGLLLVAHVALFGFLLGPFDFHLVSSWLSVCLCPSLMVSVSLSFDTRLVAVCLLWFR